MRFDKIPIGDIEANVFYENIRIVRVLKCLHPNYVPF